MQLSSFSMETASEHGIKHMPTLHLFIHLRKMERLIETFKVSKNVEISSKAQLPKSGGSGYSVAVFIREIASLIYKALILFRFELKA